MPTPSDVERAAEHCLRERFNCVVTVRAMRTKFARQDLFASDVLGKRPLGSMVYAQATKGKSAAVAARRRKMEAIPWCYTDSVFLLEFRQERDGRRNRYEFRVHEYQRVGVVKPRWRVMDTRIEVPSSWFKAWKPAESLQKPEVA